MKEKANKMAAICAALAAGSAFANARISAQDASCWAKSEWISVPGAPVFNGTVDNYSCAAPGTSCFAAEIANAREVKSVKWMTAGLGVYEVYANGKRVGSDFLKPGFTNNRKTKYSFAYDVTDLVNTAAGAKNLFAAEVSAGWWRDKICTPAGSEGFAGRKSAFRGVLQYTYADGTVETFGTNVGDWRGMVGGPVLAASIFDGEEYDARRASASALAGEMEPVERNFEFGGAIVPTAGAEVVLREDLAMAPVRAYAWKGISGAGDEAFGTVNVIREFAPGEAVELPADATVVMDFGQNAAAVPSFRFSAAAGTTMEIRPAEMLNDGNGAKSRGCDGPEGSVYRANLREGWENRRLARYTFAGTGVEEYMPRFTFFGYRYLSLTATGPVRIEKVESVPVSSIAEDMERGRIRTGDESLNRFLSNVRWGQLSNYLSVPTDCPQRNERIGWTADTQVFAETALYNADVASFLRKWMRDMRDSQHDDGSFPSVAPFAQYGNEGHRVGWADAGVIVPYVVWKMSGDTAIVRENFAAMEKFLAMQESTKYRTVRNPDGTYDWQYADWLSFEDYEHCYGTAFDRIDGKRVLKPSALRYWNFLAGCYWHWDAALMAEMSAAIGCEKAKAKYEAMAAKALAYVRSEFLDPEDGMLEKDFRHLQGAAVFALRFGVIEREDAVAATRKALADNIAAHGGCNMTGFLGTPLMMDVLVGGGMADLAYSLLLNHKFPSWLYSVDQGATTVWERWNSYTKKDGFGPVDMNSFNHYAYGCVMGWIYRTVCGIAADPKAPGFRNIVMKPVPDRRLGFAEAEFDSHAGLIKSAWRYDGDVWTWTFTIPEGATASVTVPGETESVTYAAGTHTISKELK